MKSLFVPLILMFALVSVENAVFADGIAAGSVSTCVIDSRNSGVYCTGSNLHGQLGNGSTMSGSNVPVATTLTQGVSEIAAGNYFSCAIVNGVVNCWGENTFGQLGRGTSGAGLYSAIPTPIAVTLPAPAIAITAGEWHVCALLSNGDIYCWGEGSEYALGNGVSSPSNPLPVKVNKPAGLTAYGVTAGAHHTCALFGTSASTASAYCWGYNNHGQTGVPAASALFVPTPTLVSGMTGAVTDISGGGFFTCAIANGAVYCWGRGDHYLLGGYLETNIPQMIPGMSAGYRIVRASLDGLFACALNGFQSLKCWGDDASGQLGPSVQVGGATGEPQTVIAKGMWVSDLSVGAGQACARYNALQYGAPGPYVCWGNGADGQLGNNATPAAQTTLVTMIGVK